MTNKYETPVVDKLMNGSDLDSLPVFCWDRGHGYDTYMHLVKANDYQGPLSQEAFDKILEELEAECVEYHRLTSGGE